MRTTTFVTNGVSLLGSLGIATSLLYFTSVVLSFVPGFSWVSELMIGDKQSFNWGFAWVVIPYVLLVAHFYLRTRLGQWLVDRGELDTAIRYCSKRTRSSLLRSRTEALAHRIALSNAWLAKAETDAALDALGGKPRVSNPKYWRWAGHVAECLFRADRTEDLRAHFHDIGPPRSRRAALYAAVGAHHFFEEQDHQSCRQFLDHAEWADRRSLRLQLSRAAIRGVALQPAQVQSAVRQAPGRAGEYWEYSVGEDRSLDDPRSARIYGAKEDE